MNDTEKTKCRDEFLRLAKILKDGCQNDMKWDDEKERCICPFNAYGKEYCVFYDLVESYPCDWDIEEAEKTRKEINDK